MNNPNYGQQPNNPNPNSGFDATADNAADGLVNQGLAGIEGKIPGGQAIGGMVNSKVDQMVNNEINTELNKSSGGIIGTIKRLLGLGN